MKHLTAPFTPEQVKNLRAWQESDYVHPFTCCDHQTMTVETDGFHCPKCGGVQTWCHDFMASGKIRNPLAAFNEVPAKKWKEMI